jgi:hypothetical protein
MSFYSSIASELLLGNLKSQYDVEHIYNAENQCSWYVYCILDNLKNNNWSVLLDNQYLTNLHIQSLESASQFRNLNKKVSWGESIFSKTIQSQFNFAIGSPRTIHIGNCVNNNYLTNENMDKIINFKLSLPKTSISEFAKLVSETQYTNTYILVNRHGQSFLIYPCGNTKYIIFDSHVREIGIFNHNSVIKYVLNNSSDNLVTYIVGYMSNEKINSVTYDDTNNNRVMI